MVAGVFDAYEAEGKRNRLGWSTPLQRHALPGEVSFGVETEDIDAKTCFYFFTPGIDRFDSTVFGFRYDEPITWSIPGY